MALISKTYTFSAGAVIVAAEHNTNFDTIYNDYNGNITNDNISATASIVDTKFAQITTASKVHGSSLTGLASVPSGAGVLPVANGSTGQSSWTQGDLLYATGATALAKLAKGTALQVLKMNSGATAPEWGDNAIAVFTSDDTWTCPSGVTDVFITACGAGGGGGGSDDTAANKGGGGGGAGSWGIRVRYPVTASTVYDITIGVGGTGGTGAANGGDGTDTTIAPSGGGTTLTFSHGSGGGGEATGTAGASGAAVTGAASGATGGQYIRYAGGAAAAGGNTGGADAGGGGGGTPFGAGGNGGLAGQNDGDDGVGFGSGGGGGGNSAAGGAGEQTGGDGMGGLLILEFPV